MVCVPVCSTAVFPKVGSEWAFLEKMPKDKMTFMDQNITHFSLLPHQADCQFLRTHPSPPLGLRAWRKCRWEQCALKNSKQNSKRNLQKGFLSPQCFSFELNFHQISASLPHSLPDYLYFIFSLRHFHIRPAPPPPPPPSPPLEKEKSPFNLLSLPFPMVSAIKSDPAAPTSRVKHPGTNQSTAGFHGWRILQRRKLYRLYLSFFLLPDDRTSHINNMKYKCQQWGTLIHNFFLTSCFGRKHGDEEMKCFSAVVYLQQDGNHC